MKRKYCEGTRRCLPCFLPTRPYRRAKVRNVTGPSFTPENAATVNGARRMGLL